MKPRGIAFAVESISKLNGDLEPLERVILAKIQDFNIHYVIKTLDSFHNRR